MKFCRRANRKHRAKPCFADGRRLIDEVWINSDDEGRCLRCRGECDTRSDELDAAAGGTTPRGQETRDESKMSTGNGVRHAQPSKWSLSPPKRDQSWSDGYSDTRDLAETMASGGSASYETNGEYVIRDGLTEVLQRATTSIAPTDEHARGVSTPHA